MHGSSEGVLGGVYLAHGIFSIAEDALASWSCDN